MGPFALALFCYQILWLSDDATPTTPSPRPSAPGTQMGQGGLVPELSLGTSGSAKPTPARPQQTSPDPEFATEVKKKISRQSAALLSFPLRHFQQHSPLLCSHQQGVLRIHLVEAQSLIAKDNFMGGMVKGKSDPYVKIRVAGITYRSHTIKENLNPIWNELYEVCLMPPEVYVFFLIHFS